MKYAVRKKNAAGIPRVSDESDKEIKYRPSQVYSETSAETRANCNRPRVTVEKLPAVKDESQSGNDDRDVSHPYEELPLEEPCPPIATYEQVDKNDSDDEKNRRYSASSTPRER